MNRAQILKVRNCKVHIKKVLEAIQIKRNKLAPLNQYIFQD